ncbi:UNVERIFIED_CONTAM: hypothetical protein Slati_2764100 [Sesamum latifolium]|uniref:Gag-pol polyprotein n=1 Tax=Sesamum latifolium TaxID=2727402 RepID=A0AAW2VYV9_9LAMI
MDISKSIYVGRRLKEPDLFKKENQTKSRRQKTGKARKVHDVTIKEVSDVEAMEDAPIIQFGRAEHSGPKNSHNDALVITALLANYEAGRIFIDSGSSANILFGEARNDPSSRDDPTPFNIGDRACPENIHAKIPGWDVPSAYNVIVGRPTLNVFQAIISMFHMKIKFPTPGGVKEVQGDPLQSQKCYIEAVRKGQKSSPDEVLMEAPSYKRGKDDESEEEPKIGRGTPLKSSR